MIESFDADQDYPRLDHFLVENIPGYSRSQLVKFITAGKVKINGILVSKKNREIITGDLVEIELPETSPQDISDLPRTYTPSVELKKLYEDDYLLIIDKPTGIAVHPGAGDRTETILDIFGYYYPQILEMEVEPGVEIDTGMSLEEEQYPGLEEEIDIDNDLDDEVVSISSHGPGVTPGETPGAGAGHIDRPGIVHRLDKETSGVLVLAKDYMTMQRMQALFKMREVSKAYLALVSGHMRFRNGTIDVPLMRSRRDRKKFSVALGDFADRGREAQTGFSVLRQFENFSYVKLFPRTGRTHQIRVHLAHFGCPVLGDRLYGRGHRGKNQQVDMKEIRRLALHAYSITFEHPITGHRLTATSPFPQVFREFLKEQMHPPT